MAHLEPRLQFLTRPDGGRVAYTTWGSGLPLVRPPGLISHQGLFALQSQECLFASTLAALPSPWMEIHYDRQGTGLSSRERTDFRFEGMLDELEAVVDYLELPQFALLCSSASAMLGVAYAVRHPERVARLIGVNASAHGSSFNVQQLIEALNALVAVAQAEWDIGFEALAQLLFPSMPTEALRAVTSTRWDETWASTALALLAAFRSHDVTALLPQVSVPTLIMHSRGDRVVHFSAGVELAARIPGARFVSVDGHAHSLFQGEEAAVVRREILDFLGDETSSKSSRSFAAKVLAQPALSQQQLRVLRLIAQGKSSREIANDLVLSERTVQRHIANLYAKIHVHNRAEATAFALRLVHAGLPVR